jgi:hypothetical protein
LLAGFLNPTLLLGLVLGLTTRHVPKGRLGARIFVGGTPLVFGDGEGHRLRAHALVSTEVRLKFEQLAHRVFPFCRS